MFREAYLQESGEGGKGGLNVHLYLDLVNFSLHVGWEKDKNL